jgi:hypothetical protein
MRNRKDREIAIEIEGGMEHKQGGDRTHEQEGKWTGLASKPLRERECESERARCDGSESDMEIMKDIETKHFAEMTFSEILDIDIRDSPSSPSLPPLSVPRSIFIYRAQIET